MTDPLTTIAEAYRSIAETLLRLQATHRLALRLPALTLVILGIGFLSLAGIAYTHRTMLREFRAEQQTIRHVMLSLAVQQEVILKQLQSR